MVSHQRRHQALQRPLLLMGLHSCRTVREPMLRPSPNTSESKSSVTAWLEFAWNGEESEDRLRGICPEYAESVVEMPSVVFQWRWDEMRGHDPLLLSKEAWRSSDELWGFFRLRGQKVLQQEIKNAWRTSCWMGSSSQAHVLHVPVAAERNDSQSFPAVLQHPPVWSLFLWERFSSTGETS